MEEPSAAGLMNAGYLISFSTRSMTAWRSFLSCSRVNHTKSSTWKPAPRRICFIAILSMPMAEPSTPEDAYGMFAISSRP